MACSEFAASAYWQPTAQTAAPGCEVAADVARHMLDGDPYNDDEVLRGAVMAPSALGLADLGLGLGSSAAAVVRGLALMGSKTCGSAVADADDDHSDNTPPFGAEDVDAAVDGSGCSNATSFHAEDRPRWVPLDPLFRLEATTLHVRSGTTAPDLGNSVLDFLRERAAVLWMRVNRSKFSIRAEVLSDDGSLCGVKLRIYETAHGAFAAELQRRRGDAVAFVRLFRRLGLFLLARGFWVAGGLPRDLLLRVAAQGDPEDSPPALADLEPLCDMAEHADVLDATLRAEVAAGLGRAARAARSAGLRPGDKRAADALAKLLSVSGDQAPFLAATAAMGR